MNFRDNDGAIACPLSSQLTSAKRHKKKVQGYHYRIPEINKLNSMEEVEDALLNDEKSLKYEYKKQIHRIISRPFESYDDDEKLYKHILWCDRDFVRQLTVKKLFVDGTFRARPKVRISRRKS